MTSAEIRCIRCGGHITMRRQGAERLFAYRVFPALRIVADVTIPTCSRCFARYIDEQTAATLQPLLAAACKRELSRRAKQSIAALAPTTSQASLERLLGLSQGYLSRINCGLGDTSPQLVILLALLARDPSLLEWVTCYWAGEQLS